MSETKTTTTNTTEAFGGGRPAPHHRGPLSLAAVIVAVALATAAVAALLVSIFTRKQEARQPFVRLVEVNELTTDPAQWGKNWPREYDSYQRTVDTTRTRYGGSEAMPAQKLERDPWLKRMYAGYAFSIDFRDRRGHAYMLFDQEHTERITKKPQPGACLHCHASIAPTWRRVGLEAKGKSLADVDQFDFDWPSVMLGFEKMSAMTYANAHAELLKTPDGTPDQDNAGGGAQPKTGGASPTTKEALAAHVGKAHPVACVDCHDPRSMQLRITRPGFVNGIKALKAKEGKRDYDPNRDATRQEMRSFVCGQCHVEYYCGPKVTLFFPWNNGLKVEEIESYYDNYKFPDGHRFFDWQHGETGAELIKAQHPEFEMFNQGAHAKAGVACADCHMPYVREGAMKVSDHHVRSPLLMVNRSCQVCHPFPEAELTERVITIQNRTHDLIQRSSVALVDMLDSIKAARQAGVSPEQIKPVLELQRKAQWRLDFVSSENSMGFHAPQESARVLAESIDYSRQAAAAAQALHLTTPKVPASLPATQPVEGITPADKAPPAPYKPLAQPEPSANH
jgi:nitrite reductase (cytochrome c-552)